MASLEKTRKEKDYISGSKDCDRNCEVPNRLASCESDESCESEESDESSADSSEEFQKLDKSNNQRYAKTSKER